MSKISEWILDKEQKGNPVIIENDSNNDAHGEDDFKIMKEVGFIFDQQTDRKVMYGAKK